MIARAINDQLQMGAQMAYALTKSATWYWYETGFCPAGKNNAIFNRCKGITCTFVNSAWTDQPSTYRSTCRRDRPPTSTSSMMLRTNNYTVGSALTSASFPFTAFLKENLHNILSISFEGFGPHTSSGPSASTAEPFIGWPFLSLQFSGGHGEAAGTMQQP
jgi:hypothetical protein